MNLLWCFRMCVRIVSHLHLHLYIFNSVTSDRWCIKKYPAPPFEKKRKIMRIDSIKLLCHTLHTNWFYPINLYFVSGHFHRITQCSKMVNFFLQLLKVIWIYIVQYKFNEDGQRERERAEKLAFDFVTWAKARIFHTCIFYAHHITQYIYVYAVCNTIT